MHGVFLPGGREVELKQITEPDPGHGQAVPRMRASTICGSGERAIYRERPGEGPEAYRAAGAGGKAGPMAGDMS